MLVFLIGFMGAGKSTVGQHVAQKTGCSFIDLDAAIELKTGKSISNIFSAEGEEAFRIIESETLRELEGKAKTIVAVGGGCAVFNDNMEWMNSHGITVYLRATCGTLFHRLMPVKKKRPLIAGLSDVQLMEYILEKVPRREAYYNQSQVIIDTANEQASVLVVRILDALKKVAGQSAYH